LNLHQKVYETDFSVNDYAYKLNILNEARRNQLQAEILSVNIFTEVQTELEKVEDLLRPWLK